MSVSRRDDVRSGFVDGGVDQHCSSVHQLVCTAFEDVAFVINSDQVRSPHLIERTAERIDLYGCLVYSLFFEAHKSI